MSSEQHGQRPPAMKWLERTAQGFSPGETANGAALKGRPNGVQLFYSHSWPVKCPPARAAPKTAALTGRLLCGRYPGLKPWAVLLNHFMVEIPKH